MGMIECINHKEMFISNKEIIIFKLQDIIDKIDDIITSMRDAGSSKDSIELLMNAREQLHFEKRKAEDEIKKMEALKCEYRTTTALTVESSREKGM